MWAYHHCCPALHLPLHRITTADYHCPSHHLTSPLLPLAPALLPHVTPAASHITPAAPHITLAAPHITHAAPHHPCCSPHHPCCPTRHPCTASPLLPSHHPRCPSHTPLPPHVTLLFTCRYMGACDMVITKAGPGTMAEALIAGLPIMLNGFVPGQEEVRLYSGTRQRKCPAGAYAREG